MRSSKAGMVVAVGACIVVLLLTVFALELSSNQAKSRSGIEEQVHDRAVVTGSLISSLFQTVQQQVPMDSEHYGGRTVADRALDAAVGENEYVALIGPGRQVLASTPGFNSQARADLAISAALRLVSAGHLYGLGNDLPYGKSGVVNFAIAFPTRYGTRVLLTGLNPKGSVGAFIERELQSIPGVRGAHNYLLDANDVVLASTNPSERIGQVITNAASVKALERSAGEVHGKYFSQVTLANSTWRIVLVAPNGALFASVDGWHEVLPWLIFAAFAIVAFFALGLTWRVLRSRDALRSANEQLESVNGELFGANESLRRRAEELARSNEELDQFASIASHDLQEPLRKVRTFTQQLAVTEGDRLSDTGVDYLERANAAAERMQRLIEDLLRFSRVSTQGRPFASVDLAEITRDVLCDLEYQIAESNGSVHVGDLPSISADPLQMQQLIQNLISNALKFRRSDVPINIDISSTRDNGKAILTFKDNGIGFEPRYSLRIFRVFERLHGRGAYPGTGIGLALCRKIADRHGGTIVADSELGVGSTFTVTLPVTHRDEEGLTVRGGTVHVMQDLRDQHEQIDAASQLGEIHANV